MLGKTRAVKALAGRWRALCPYPVHPGSAPADLTGSEVFHPQDASFVFPTRPCSNPPGAGGRDQPAPAKVQSALLGGHGRAPDHRGQEELAPAPPSSWSPPPRTPSSRKGPIPAGRLQLDRFLLKLLVDYPSPAMELAILQLNARGDALPTPPVTLSQSDLLEARTAVHGYRCRGASSTIWCNWCAPPDPAAACAPSWNPHCGGCQPQASIGLARAARASGLALAGRDFVLPEDIQQLAPAVLRHRHPVIRRWRTTSIARRSSPCCWMPFHAPEPIPYRQPCRHDPVAEPRITPTSLLPLERLLAVRLWTRQSEACPHSSGRPRAYRAPARAAFPGSFASIRPVTRCATSTGGSPPARPPHTRLYGKSRISPLVC